MRKVSIFLLLLVLASFAVAQSQEELYYRALKAEEAEDIPTAFRLFEAAVKEPGPYTEEIQEIIDEYREALEEIERDSLKKEPESSWEFHTYGNAGYSFLHYSRNDVSDSETGSEVSSSVSVSAEYASRNWSQSFEVNLSGDWFVDKDDMPSLDTSAWEGSVGVGYSLIGNTLILDIGANMNVEEGDGWTPDFYSWIEKYFVRVDKHKFGMALWAYENLDGPLSANLYASWHRYAKYGWNGSVYLGGRFEADSISTPYWLKWVGPTLKPSYSYRFKTDISVDSKLNLFYGFVVDGPDAEYEKVQKFSGSWACHLSWRPGVWGLFVGVEQFYKIYMLPAGYEIGYPERSVYTELKAGVKWNI